jgi:hypothetical protein
VLLGTFSQFCYSDVRNSYFYNYFQNVKCAVAERICTDFARRTLQNCGVLIYYSILLRWTVDVLNVFLINIKSVVDFFHVLEMEGGHTCAQYYTPCTQYYTPCTQYYTPCTQYYTPCAQYYTPCAQYYTPCTQYYTPCAQYYTPCAQYYTPCAQLCFC